MMSEATQVDARSAHASKSKKKNKKKKGGGTKDEANGDPAGIDERPSAQETQSQEPDVAEEVPVCSRNAVGCASAADNRKESKDHSPEPVRTHEDEAEDEEESSETNEETEDTRTTNGILKQHAAKSIPKTGLSDTQTRLETLAQERDALKAEVAELRKSLELIQGKHEDETSDLQGELEEANTGKAQAETQYNDLLGRVNAIRTQLGQRLKSYAVRTPLHMTKDTMLIFS